MVITASSGVGTGAALALPPHVQLKVEDLQTYFIQGASTVKSVDGVSFSLSRGQTLAVVGESGSGKSVTSLTIMRLLAHPGRIVGGHVLYRLRAGGVVDLAQLPEKRMRAIRGREIAMIFQEPMTSLNPLFTVGGQIGEKVRLHEPVSRGRRASGPRPCSTLSRFLRPQDASTTIRTSSRAACASGGQPPWLWAE